MSSKGQVTAFIIVGIVIVILISAFLLISYRSTKETLQEQAIEVQETVGLAAPIQQYVQSCLKNTAEKAILFVSKHGGYYELPPESDDFFLMPYYFYENKSYVPNKEEIEKQLSLFVDTELPFCLQNFIVFREQGYEISGEGIHTTAIISENKTIFTATYPMRIKKENAQTSLQDFSASIPSRLGTIYTVAKKLIDEQVNDTQSICVSCVTLLGIENDLRVELSFINEQETMFTIIDTIVLINQEQLRFNFINQYSFAAEIASGINEINESENNE